MLILLWVLWVIFNGRVTWEIAFSGLAFAGALYAAMCCFGGFSPRKDARLLRRVPQGLKYLGLLVAEIFVANFQVMRFILSGKYEVEPRLASFRTKLRRPVYRAVLADSITLTPGTITVTVEDDLYTVHCLDDSLVEGLRDSAFERRLLEMEEDRA